MVKKLCIIQNLERKSLATFRKIALPLRHTQTSICFYYDSSLQPLLPLMSAPLSFSAFCLPWLPFHATLNRQGCNNPATNECPNNPARVWEVHCKSHQITVIAKFLQPDTSRTPTAARGAATRMDTTSTPVPAPRSKNNAHATRPFVRGGGLHRRAPPGLQWQDYSSVQLGGGGTSHNVCNKYE